MSQIVLAIIERTLNLFQVNFHVNLRQQALFDIEHLLQGSSINKLFLGLIKLSSEVMQLS